MSNEQDMSSRLGQWLGSLLGNREPVAGASVPLSAVEVQDLLQRAGRCYVVAGWVGDAARVFQQAGDFRKAAVYYEQECNWLLAGQCYQTSGLWKEAGRCFVRCGQWSQATQCYEKAGEVIEAGWISAHCLLRFQHARALVEPIKPTKDEDRLGKELVLARCDIGLERPKDAAKRLKAVVVVLADFSVGWERPRLDSWAIEIAQLLRRPDLIVSLHAAAVTAKVPGAVEKWESWALEHLGETAGIEGS